MGSVERSKKKVQLWKKAMFHFILCFAMGFFTGFAPMGKASFFSALSRTTEALSLQTQPVEVPKPSNFNGSFSSADAPESADGDVERLKFLEDETQQEKGEPKAEEDMNLIPGKPLIIVTPTSSRDRFQDVFLRRLANTLRLVPPPLLWVIVEGQSSSNIEVTEILRRSGIMYRYLVSKENFTDRAAEMDHHRNIALRHIEQHRLTGIVHFAGTSNVYDLDFFEELRDIEVLGTWPMASLSGNRKKMAIEGPVCDGWRVIGWHLKRRDDDEDEANEIERSLLHISNFAFNSSILWDPERWGRPSSSQATSQDPLKFVKEALFEDETKLKAIPGRDCSRVMHWHLQYPPSSPTFFHDI